MKSTIDPGAPGSSLRFDNRQSSTNVGIEGSRDQGIKVAIGRLSLLVILSACSVGFWPAISAAQEPAGAPRSLYAPNVEEILTRLEKRSDGLQDIQAKVVFVEDDQVNLAKGKKWGSIRFLMTQPNPHFMIHFNRTEFDGVVGKNEWYLFDGQWLYQAVERTKTIAKQQMAAEGERLDLFDIEKTPFPLPFGQKKDAILKNFDVSIISASKDDPPNSDHLMLIPRSTSRVYGKYDRIDMHVDRAVHLPRRIVVSKNKGMETSTADFPDLSNGSINTGLSESDFLMPKEWRGYKQTVEELVPKE